MGNVRSARLTHAGRTWEGQALLETAELVFRGEDHREVFRFADMKNVAAHGPFLMINDDIVLDLGSDAPKWAEKIRNPKSVMQKLGIKPGQQVSVVHLDDETFAAELERAGARVARGKNRDAIFYGADERADLARIEGLKESLAPNGALWVIRPKGVKAITEADVVRAGQSAGLVDVKVVKFSETHTAEKFVIPVARRQQ